MQSRESYETRVQYTLILLVSLFVLIFPGSLISFLLSGVDFFSSTKAGVFILAFVPHLLTAAAVEILLRFFFHRGMLSYVERRINIWRFIRTVLVSLLLYSLYSLLSLKYIERNEVDAGSFLLFLTLSIVLFLPQTLTEEIIFRVLPHRIFFSCGGNQSIGKKIAVSVFCGLFFLLAHIYNTEVLSSSNLPVVQFLFYFLWGFLSSLFSLHFLSYTSVWGMHYANNLFSTAAVGGVNSTLVGCPLFIDSRTYSSPLLLLLISLLFLIIFLIDEARK